MDATNLSTSDAANVKQASASAVAIALRRAQDWIAKQRNRIVTDEDRQRAADIRDGCGLILNQSPSDYGPWAERKDRRRLLQDVTQFATSPDVNQALYDLAVLAESDVLACDQETFLPVRKVGPLPWVSGISSGPLSEARRAALERAREVARQRKVSEHQMSVRRRLYGQKPTGEPCETPPEANGGEAPGPEASGEHPEAAA